MISLDIFLSFQVSLRHCAVWEWETREIEMSRNPGIPFDASVCGQKMGEQNILQLALQLCNPTFISLLEKFAKENFNLFDQIHGLIMISFLWPCNKLQALPDCSVVFIERQFFREIFLGNNKSGSDSCFRFPVCCWRAHNSCLLYLTEKPELRVAIQKPHYVIKSCCWPDKIFTYQYRNDASHTVVSCWQLTYPKILVVTKLG